MRFKIVVCHIRLLFCNHVGELDLWQPSATAAGRHIIEHLTEPDFVMCETIFQRDLYVCMYNTTIELPPAAHFGGQAAQISKIFIHRCPPQNQYPKKKKKDYVHMRVTNGTSLCSPNHPQPHV